MRRESVLFTVTVESGFRASHQLTMADGEKEQLHSHDWIVRVAVGAEELDDCGLGIDFIELRALIERIVSPLSDKRLDEMACFEGVNASAENVTKYIYDRIAPELATRMTLEYVEVMESAGCWTKYYR